MSRDSLRGRANARLLAGASFASNLADGIRVAAFAVISTFQTDSSFEVGLTAAIAGLPSLLLSLFVGVVIDRVDKLTLLRVTNVVRMLILCVLAALLFSGNMSLHILWLLAFAFGVCEEFYDSAATLIVPELVANEELFRSNFLVGWVQELGNGAVGPFLGALLVAASGGAPFIAAVVVLIFAGLMLREIAKERRPGSSERLDCTQGSPPLGSAEPSLGVWASGRAAVAKFVRELRQGIRFAFANRFARSIIVIYAIWNFFGWMPEGVLVVFVRDALEAPSSVFGTCLAATSLGSLLGGLIGLSTRINWSAKMAMGVGLCVYSFTMVVPAVLPSIPVALASFFIQGMPLIILGSAVVTEMQTTIPRRYYARVYSVIGAVGGSAMTGGLIFGGWLAEETSTNVVMLISGGGLLVAAVAAFVGFSGKRSEGAIT